MKNPEKATKDRGTGVTWHPAHGSKLTLAEAMRDPAALPPEDFAEIPEGTDVLEYLAQRAPQYLRAAERLAREVEAAGQAALACRVYRDLARLALGPSDKRRRRAAPDAYQEPAGEEVDYSKLSLEELYRLAYPDKS
jgi:hypothetical protein